jgi:spore maturation protein CgeB
MRVFICNRPGGAFGYITDGWLNALRDRGHEAMRWDGNQDSWRVFNPELYIGCSGHKQPIPAKRNTKIAIHVNPYGPVEIPGIMESKQSIEWTKNQKPDVVFGYGQEEDRLVWSYWTKKLGITWIPMPTAGDKILFNLTNQDIREFDIVYLGGRWPYKAQTIDTFLLPVLKGGLSYQVYGWGDWPSNICSGILPADKVNQFLNNGRIGPCISERHTHQFGIDIPERAFKLALCGTVVVHDSVPTLKRMIPSAIVSCNHEEFLHQCIRLSSSGSEKERTDLARKQREEVLSAHTYHHRMSTLMEAVGFTTEARTMLDG